MAAAGFSIISPLFSILWFDTSSSPPRLTFLPLCASFRGHSATRMAKHSQHQQGTSAHDAKSSCGGRQIVVELCEVSACGLVFWSRCRFEIGAEVQVRILRSTLPAHSHTAVGSDSPWVTLKGLVVACPALRREDGSSGFEVSLLIEQVPKIRSKMRWFRPRLPGLRRFGLN